MSNIVPTWEAQANPVGEIELTDTQLAMVQGAWDDHCDHNHLDWHNEDRCHKKHFEFRRAIHISIDIDVHKIVDVDKDRNRREC
ncbi:MAG TPA: hypothetical protein VGL94_14430 [Ktedonobacteraceae bacterium]|jgi:hypothetical protein